MHINDIWNAGISNESKLVAFASHIFLYRSVHSQGDHIELQQSMVTFACCLELQQPTQIQSRKMQGYDSLSQNVLKGCIQSTLPKWNTCQGCWFYQVSWHIYSLLIQYIQFITSKARRLMGLLSRQFYYNADTSTLKHQCWPCSTIQLKIGLNPLITTWIQNYWLTKSCTE